MSTEGIWIFYVHVTVHRDKFLIIKPTRCTQIYFWNENLHVSGISSVHHQEFFTVHTAMVYVIQICWQIASRIRMERSSILNLLESCQQNCMTYTNAVCTVKNSWWTEKLSETCRFSFQEKIWEISASSWFYYKKFTTMYGHMNVKCVKLVYILGKLFAKHDRRHEDMFNPYPTALPYGNGMVLHFYQQQESSTTKTVHKVINKGLKTYV